MKLVVAVALTSAIAAAGRPDFTGEWRLIQTQNPSPGQQNLASVVLQIDHRDPTLILRRLEVRGQNLREDVLFLSTDGVERLNELARETVKSIAIWRGEALEIRTWGKLQGEEIDWLDRYQLSREGRSLTLTRSSRLAAPGPGSAPGNQTLQLERVPLRAGVARVDITPAQSLPMYGYANRACGPSNGVHDPLMAKVLVLESALQRLAIVTLDLGSIVTAKLHQRVAAELNIPVLLLAASHTHSAPLFLPSAQTPTSPLGATTGAPAYREEMENKVFGAIRQASQSMFEARLRIGRGEARLGYNRLVLGDHGRARAVFDNLERLPYGPLDPEFQLLEVTDSHGEARALLVHYAVHPVVLGPSNCKFSADYPGSLQHHLEQAIPGLQAMFVQGGAGDINPLFLGRTKDEEKDFAQVERMGKLLAAEVLKVRSSMRLLPETSFPLRAESATMLFADRWDKTRSHEIGIATVLIGRDIAIATLPGEAMHKLQTLWKQEAGVAFPLFYGYTYSQGGVWAGYVPDLRTAAYGGYGADSSVTRVELGAGERILTQHRIQLFRLRGLWREQPGPP
ncbi:MAG: neutral/alkaline non-lysosomal ceramidase N-terminal domain-containing protein [Bryobacteraceae bacterium]|nr:neutral/alkaline non-lysosomal ceramidase N-terminal domain-containing protein [Bryobacteraceae bacterium]MDW8377858.1 neutral/alkaline non-lysosomal ceramidase N-terminal domain-containing protein [Bryobacterales bacterium]